MGADIIRGRRLLDVFFIFLSKIRGADIIREDTVCQILCRVSDRTLPVVFFFDSFSIPRDIKLKFCIGNLNTFI